MKKALKLFVLLLVVLTIGACSSDNGEIPTPNQNPEAILVSLKMGGEISIAHEDMTRASGNDIYGINVYYDKEGDGNVGDLYGYGVFDDPDKMIISLLASHKYIFKCTLVKSGKTTLYFDAAKVAAPFSTNNSTTTSISNEFILGTTTYLNGISSGEVQLKGATPVYTSFSSVNRFYGESDTYTPTVGGSVSIYLKRTVFGAKFIITGVANGSVTASCGEFWSHTTEENYEGAETIYNYGSMGDAWNELPQSATVTFTYTSNWDNKHYDTDKAWSISKSKNIEFKRNVMTTVIIDASAKSATFDIQEEEFDSDNNINISIDGDKIIETEVNPEEE
jgi:hypothetical protein